MSLGNRPRFMIVLVTLTLFLVLLSGCHETYQVEVEVEGQGSVRASQLTRIEAGTSVELEALPENGWTFSHWEGHLSGSGNPVSLLVERDLHVRAVFLPGYSVSVSVEGQGRVEMEPDQRGYAPGSQVRLVAVPDRGWVFQGWTGDVSGSAHQVSLLVEGQLQGRAIFEPGLGDEGLESAAKRSLAWDHRTDRLVWEGYREEALTTSDLSKVRWLEVMPDRHAKVDPVHDLTDLPRLPALSDLRIFDQDIEDPSPVGQLVHLKVLSLAQNLIQDLGPLANLSELAVLNLSRNKVRDISPLSQLKRLRVLNLSDNDIEDLAPLSGLKEVEHLDLGANRISDLSPVTGMAHLHYLDLSGNQLSSLPDLSDLSNLRWLDLSGNNLSDLSSLSSLVSLEEIDLRDNRVSDISPLMDLPGLRRALLAGNSVRDEDIATLIDRGIQVEERDESQLVIQSPDQGLILHTLSPSGLPLETEILAEAPGARDASWSPDGAFLAYPRQEDAEEESLRLDILELESGQVLETRVEIPVLGWAQLEWAPRGPYILIDLGTGFSRAYHVLRAGESVPVISLEGQGSAVWSPGGAQLAFGKLREVEAQMPWEAGGSGDVVLLDLLSGEEKTLLAGDETRMFTPHSWPGLRRLLVQVTHTDGRHGLLQVDPLQSSPVAREVEVLPYYLDPDLEELLLPGKLKGGYVTWAQGRGLGAVRLSHQGGIWDTWIITPDAGPCYDLASDVGPIWPRWRP